MLFAWLLVHASLALTWIFFFQVAAVVAFTPVGEAQSSSGVQGMAEKEAKDFFKGEWVEEPGTTISKEGLEEVVVLMDAEEVVEVAEATLEEVAV